MTALAYWASSSWYFIWQMKNRSDCKKKFFSRVWYALPACKHGKGEASTQYDEWIPNKQETVVRRRFGYGKNDNQEDCKSQYLKSTHEVSMHTYFRKELTHSWWRWVLLWRYEARRHPDGAADSDEDANLLWVLVSLAGATSVAGSNGVIWFLLNNFEVDKENAAKLPNFFPSCGLVDMYLLMTWLDDCINILWILTVTLWIDVTHFHISWCIRRWQ